MKILLLACALVWPSTALAQSAPNPQTLPSGALLPPSRDFFELDATKELEKSAGLTTCRFVPVKKITDPNCETAKTTKYVYTCQKD